MSNNTCKFKVGQVWRARDGSSHTILFIEEGGNWDFPVRSHEYAWSTDGQYPSRHIIPHPLDLVELIEDVADPVAEKPKPQFRVGQVWRARDGSSHTIIYIVEEGGWTYPIRSYGHGWTPDGRFDINRLGEDHPLDLVELIADAPDQTLTWPPPRFEPGGLNTKLLVAAVQGFCSGFAASNDIWPDSRDPSHYEVVAEHALRIVDAVIAEIEKRGGAA